jgi:hypothetical protein
MRPLHASLALLALTGPALADQGDDDALEVVVTADPYARWEHTRWRIDTQVALPYPVPLYAAVNHEVQVVAYDLSLVLACDLGEPVTRRSREVDCVIEDAAVRASPWLRDPPAGQAVLDETDRRLTGLDIRLQVTEEGEIATIGLHGEPEGNRRTGIQYENLRQLVSRAFVGFHMQVPPRFVIGKDWYERNSRLFSLPAFRWLAIAEGGLPPAGGGNTEGALYLDGAGGSTVPNEVSVGTLVSSSGAITLSAPAPAIGVRTALTAIRQGRNSFDAMQAPASIGFSTFVHRMDVVKGRYLVQSHGEGSVDIGLEQPVTFKGTCDTAEVFDPTNAVMSERIWSMRLAPTAGSLLADGVAGWPYWHLGRLAKLGADEHPDLGPTRLVGWPGLPDGRGQLPPWPALR